MGKKLVTFVAKIDKMQLKLYLVMITKIVMQQVILAEDSIPQRKEVEIKQKLWGDIFASYYTSLNGKTKPNNAFGMPTALLGYTAT